MKLTKSLPYPIGSLMFYLFIPVAYGKMNKAMVARLTGKVSLLGVDSLWGDCTFIPADWGSQQQICAILEDFSL